MPTGCMQFAHNDKNKQKIENKNKAEGKTQHKLFFTQLINYSQSLNTQQKHISAGTLSCQRQLSGCIAVPQLDSSRLASSRSCIFKDNCEKYRLLSQLFPGRWRKGAGLGDVLRGKWQVASGKCGGGILKFSNKFIASLRAFVFIWKSAGYGNIAQPPPKTIHKISRKLYQQQHQTGSGFGEDWEESNEKIACEYFLRVNKIYLENFA